MRGNENGLELMVYEWYILYILVAESATVVGSRKKLFARFFSSSGTKILIQSSSVPTFSETVMLVFSNPTITSVTKKIAMYHTRKNHY